MGRSRVWVGTAGIFVQRKEIRINTKITIHWRCDTIAERPTRRYSTTARGVLKLKYHFVWVPLI